jgi:transposase
LKPLYYVGLDVHKKSISYCVKTASGEIVREGRIGASRSELDRWLSTLPASCVAAMEATLFSGWIYDHLKARGVPVKVADPTMLKAISASKKKNDQIDARKIADLLRCDLIQECYMAPPEMRELRRLLRFRNLLMRQSVRMKNRIAGLLMETGTSYNAGRLHGQQYFQQLLDELEGSIPDSVLHLMKLSRAAVDQLRGMEQQIITGLCRHPLLRRRVELLTSIEGVGVITALSWALETGEPQRFRTRGQAISYCGLCSAQHSSAGRESRGPISKQRNHHLQWVLVEAAKMAPRWNAMLGMVHERELQRGNRNQATLEVARKLVGYLLAVDRSGQPFQVRMQPQ